MPNNSKLLVAAFATAKPGREHELEQLLCAVAKPTRKQPGSLGVAVYRSVEQPDTPMALERWQSVEQHDHHLGSEHVRNLMAEMEPMIAGPPRIECYHIVDSVNGPQDGAALTRAIVRAYHDAWTSGNLSKAQSLLAGDIAPGRAGQKKVGRAIFAAFGDVHVEVLDTIVEGDRVVERHRATAVHKGDFMGIPATGRKVYWTESH